MNLSHSSCCAATEAAVLIFRIRVSVLNSLLQEFPPVGFCSGGAVTHFLWSELEPACHIDSQINRALCYPCASQGRRPF
jgi:hypothetical protein